MSKKRESDPGEENEDNPILFRVGNIPIREVNYAKVKYNKTEYARLAKISLVFDLPISKIIALSSQPCPICGNDHIMITIPLGLLSVKKQASGKTTNQNVKGNDKQKQDS